MLSANLNYKLFLNLTERATAGPALTEHAIPMTSIDEAIELFDQRGAPDSIMLYGLLSGQTRDRHNVLLWEYFNRLKAYLENMENQSGFGLTEPIKFHSYIPSNIARECSVDAIQINDNAIQAFRAKIDQINERFLLTQINLRRHHKVMREVGVEFETFMRLGRVGTCFSCPRVMTHKGLLVLPEQCLHTKATDHNRTLDDLVAFYKDKMAGLK